MEGWKIHRDKGRCDKPGCPLPTASEYYAILELPECQRRDLCATCFHQLGDADAEVPIYWKARRREASRKGPVIDLVSLRALFDRLGGVDDDQARGLRYFVALLLLRKRVLKMVDPENAEQEEADLVVRDPKLPEVPTVALTAPPLDSDRLATLKDELVAALEDADGAHEDAEDRAAS